MLKAVGEFTLATSVVTDEVWMHKNREEWKRKNRNAERSNEANKQAKQTSKQSCKQANKQENINKKEPSKQTKKERNNSQYSARCITTSSNKRCLFGVLSLLPSDRMFHNAFKENITQVASFRRAKLQLGVLLGF